MLDEIKWNSDADKWAFIQDLQIHGTAYSKTVDGYKVHIPIGNVVKSTSDRAEVYVYMGPTDE